MQRIKRIKNLRILSLIIFSLFLTSSFSVFAPRAESAGASPLTLSQSDGVDINKLRVSAGFLNNTPGALSGPAGTDHPEYVEGEVLVVIDAPATSAYSVMGAFSENAYSQAVEFQADTLARNFGLEARKTYPEIARRSRKSIIHYRSAGKSTEELIQELSSVPNVVNVSPNYIAKLDDTPANQLSTKYNATDTDLTPNDPYYPPTTENPLGLWGMENIGMPLVWDYFTGSDTVVVAVIDSGIDYNHPDLEPNMARDSYGNYGSRFQNGAQRDDPLDVNGHGTHVAGTIGAAGDNGIGVVGVNWQVKLLAVNVLPNGSGAWSDIIAGIEYVVSEKNKGLNIRVANMSFGGLSDPLADDSPLGTAVKSLSDAGIICAISAGNDGRNLNSLSTRYYPAGFRFSNTITVGAIDSNNERSVWSSSSSSNYGNEWVDIAAPGSDIFSTLPLINNGYRSEYGTLSGTSMAAPHVTGAAALLCAAYPNESASQIKARLLSKARNIGVSSGFWANGILDVWGAYGAPEITTTSLFGGAVGLSYSQTLRTKGIAPIAWTIEGGNLPDGLNLNGATGEIYGVPDSTGTFNFTVKATSTAGADTKSLSIVVTATPVAPIINASSLPDGVIGFPYSQTLSASGTAPIIWTIEAGSLPNGLSLNGATGEIYGTPLSAGAFSFTVRASNSAGADAKNFSILIPAPIYVAGVTLNKNAASLHVAEYEYLTATVNPTDALNKKVTWSSSNPAVATVNDYGLVTAVSAGTATITVTTVDGGFHDTCQVTVTSYLFQSGSGTQTDPFIITTAAELDDARNILGAHYKLGNNIDLNAYLLPGGAGYAKWGGAGWMPIGTLAAPFTGSFDGNGYKVSNLRIIGRSYAGLFGSTFGFGNSIIKNLGVEISDCRFTGGVSGPLVGFCHGNIDNCYVTGGNVTSNWVQVGGLVGWQEWGAITNCYTTVNVDAIQNVGGLVGVQRGSIESSYATGNVSVNNYATGDYSTIGGLVGSNEGPISNSYATGNVSGAIGVGGLTGQATNIIKNSYATGNVIGSERVGGLTGGSWNAIINCYATGDVNGNSYGVGGLVGIKGNINVEIVNSYRYEFATMNNTAIPASDPESSPNGRHGGTVTISQLMNKATYTGNSWLFNDSIPTAGPWYWDSRSFPKLNIGSENFPFDFAPTMTKHPQNRTVAVGNTAVFSVTVFGNAPLTYQWQRSDNNGASWSNVGTNASTHSFTAQTTDNGAQFRVTVINNYGNVTSSIAVLTVGTSLPVGNGTEGDPYIITTPTQLNEVRNYLDAYYRLGADIDLSAYLAPGGAGYDNWGPKGWEPIGNLYDQFTGNFDGNGYNVTGLWIDRSSIEYVGLFGRAFGAEIRNLGVEIDTEVNGDVYVGGLAGYLTKSSIENCYATGNVNGSRIIGGLVGSQNMESSVINSYATGNVNASNTDSDFRSHAGGLIGSSEGVISNCYAAGNVSASGVAVGGLAGECNSISNSYATGAVTGGEWVGGLVGGAYGAVTNSYATGNTSGDSDVGGIMGAVLWNINIGSTGSISSSYRYQFATVNGAVRAENTPNGVHGGIVASYELMTKATYTGNGWLFNDSAPAAGPWHWDSRSFPKLNIGAESFPFNFVTSPFAGGSGTLGDPYIITTAEELDEARNYLSAHFMLGNDINLSAYLSPGGAGHAKWGAEGWEPIGTSSPAVPFTGKLDGSGYKITGLWINRNSANPVGLFGRTLEAEIRNLVVEISDAGVSGNNFVGGLVGYLSGGSIETSGATGNVGGNSYVGGLVGYSNGSITKSYATGDVSSNNFSGGLVGYFDDSSIINCYATGNVSGNDIVGGLVGIQTARNNNICALQDSYASGSVIATEGAAGGLIGRQNVNGEGSNSIIKCYATGNVNGSSQAGGLIGFQSESEGSNSIIKCYATGNVNSSSQAGGLIGFQSVSEGSNSIIECYATGNVDSSRYSGGLIGNRQSTGTGVNSITKSYATGDVSSNSFSGGLVGYQTTNTGSVNVITNCYATGNVSSDSYSGGLMGLQNGGSIEYCYATGNVSGNYFAGGLVGNSSASSISNCYAIGNIRCGSSSAGGLAGNISNSTITNSYRYINLTINGAVIPASNPDSAPDKKHGGVKTEAELMTKATYTGNDWLFNDSAPAAGPWYWDSRDFPKLNIGMEGFPFPWDVTPVITITAQPAPNTTVTQGSISGSLSVSASVTQGATLTYQWYRNTTNSNTGGSIETGAEGASFAIPTNLTAAGSPYYFYCVASAPGAVPVHSNAATVTVNTGSIDPTGVTLDKDFITIAIGGDEQLTATVLPPNATNKNVTWSSSNTAVATVSSGLVTGVAQGTATIVVTTVVAGFTYSCEVTVTGDEPDNPPVISGPVYMELSEGYGATASNIFKITGTEPVTVTKTSGHANIAWDDASKKLNIAAGLPAGSYPVVLTASNGVAPNATHTFTLTVINVPPGSAKLYFAPGYITAGLDRTFTITFNVNSGQYNQVECVLAYDPELLEPEAVTQIPPSADWTLINYSDWGKASFILTPIIGSGAMLDGDNAIATLRFKALVETPGTDISIIQLHGNGAGSSKLKRQVVSVAEDIPFTTQGCVVTIVDGVATLKVSFQGRSAGAANIENLNVKWVSGNAVIAEEMVTTDQNGEAEIIIPLQNSGLTIWVKGERTLATSQYIGTVENGSVINAGILPGGDSNGDNVVDLNDYNVFLYNYGKSSNSPGFNQFADFNNDGVVDLNDFNIFLSNYGKTGAQFPGGYAPSAMSMMSYNEDSEELSVNDSDPDSGCNMGMIGYALLMLSALPLFRKTK